MRNQFQYPSTKGPAVSLIALAVLYIVARLVLGVNNSVIILNGVLFGFFVAYVIAFADLFRDAILNNQPYDRVKRMATGIFFVSSAVAMMVCASIYNRALGLPVVMTETQPLVRFLALVGLGVQISAPDFGRGLFFGRDRVLLTVAGVIGGVIALVVILLQAN